MDWLLLLAWNYLVSVQTIQLLLSWENTLPQLFQFLQSVRWSWSAATCLLPCLRVFLCWEQTIQVLHLNVSLFAICEILEATCLIWCLLNFQLQSQDSTSPSSPLIQVAILPSSHPSGCPGISSSSPQLIQVAIPVSYTCSSSSQRRRRALASAKLYFTSGR